MPPEYHLTEKNVLDGNGPLNTFIITAIHGKYIERCLSSLWKTIDPEKHRLIFVEGPSVEDRETLYPLVEEYADIYMRTKKNYGFSKSINLALRNVYTPYFTIVHDDVWFPHGGWWNACMKVLLEDPDLYMVQPIQRNRREAEALPYPLSDVQYADLLEKSRGHGISEIYCMVFKSEWLDKAGYFDERIYPIGPEDLEWYRQAQAYGMRVAVTNQALVYHKGAGRDDASGGSRQDLGNLADLDAKWGGVKGQANGGLSTGESIQPKHANLIRNL